MNYEIGLFVLLQFINVVLSTMRSVLTVKANARTAALMNAISYCFYNGLIKILTAQSMPVILATTFFTNIFGVYLARWIIMKTAKAKVWRITIICHGEEQVKQVCNGLKRRSIQYVSNDCYGNTFTVDAISRTYGESEIVKEIVDRYNLTYYIVELSKRL